MPSDLAILPSTAGSLGNIAKYCRVNWQFCRVLPRLAKCCFHNQDFKWVLFSTGEIDISGCYFEVGVIVGVIARRAAAAATQQQHTQQHEAALAERQQQQFCILDESTLSGGVRATVRPMSSSLNNGRVSMSILKCQNGLDMIQISG
jgi:hypothetical protein